MLEQLLGATKTQVAGMWNNPHMSAFRNYASQGGMWAVGFEPTYVKSGEGLMGPLPRGQSRGTTWQGYGAYANRGVNGLSAVGSMSGGIAKRGMAMAASGAGLAFSGYNIYSGYKEGGIWGAKDAAVWEVAAGSAAARFAYGSVGSSGPSANIGLRARLAGIGMKNAGTAVAFGGGAGMGAGMARAGGAVLGASIGQAVLGTPGAFIGGFIGAAPLRFAATHPLIAGGMIATAGAAAVGYGTYSVVKGGLKAGYDHRQRQKGIDTSGSMAAFMTQGAMTMRSRAVQSIHKSHLNARSALGQEAGFMHMPSKNYHSRYR